MKLNYAGLQDRAAWEAAGIALPEFDWKEMCAQTEASPTWVHFGTGNIFRAFIAPVQQSLLNQGLAKGGIVAVATYDFENINRVYLPFDCMTMAVSLLPDGSMKKELVASVAKALRAGSAHPEEREALMEIFRKPSLQLASTIITEKGYALMAWAHAAGPFAKSASAWGKNRPLISVSA